MKKLHAELITKAKEAKTEQELLELANASGIELTEIEAKTYFKQINASDAIDDDDIDAVAGGSSCGSEENDNQGQSTAPDDIKNNPRRFG